MNGVLAISRALGDHTLKSHDVVTAHPYITSTEIMPDHKYLLLACDGVRRAGARVRSAALLASHGPAAAQLWDEMSDQQAVRQAEGGWTLLVQAPTDCCLRADRFCARQARGDGKGCVAPLGGRRCTAGD